MKNLIAIVLILASINLNAQMLQAVKSTLQNHLSDNSNITNFIGGLNISDATMDIDNKTITVIGTFTHKGFWTNVDKPFVANVKVVLDEMTVDRLCFYKYLSAIDQWELKCTNSKNGIVPLPEYPKKF